MKTRLLWCNPPMIVASPVVSLAAICPQTAKLEAKKSVRRSFQNFFEYFLLIFHTIIMPQSFPPRLIKCSSSDEKHKPWTRTLCSSCLKISHFFSQSQTIRCERNPMWLTWPEATNLPLGETSRHEMLWVWPERNSCLFVFMLRIEILFPIAKTRCSWSGCTFRGIFPVENLKMIF